MPGLSKGEAPSKGKARAGGDAGRVQAMAAVGLVEHMMCVGTWPPQSDSLGLALRSAVFTIYVT